MAAVAVDLTALGDVGRLWRDWEEDATRRFRVTNVETELPNWRRLLERFAEERAPVYLRRDPEVTQALRRLAAAGTRIGVFTDAPDELARIALSHLGAERHIDVLETGAGAEDRVVRRLGDSATVVRTRAELIAVT